jgi:hypothetical protein
MSVDPFLKIGTSTALYFKKMALKRTPQLATLRGANASLKSRENEAPFWSFERIERIRGNPLDASGAKGRTAEIPIGIGKPTIETLPSRGDYTKVNVLEGLELHVDVLTEDEEIVMVCFMWM